MSCVGSPAIWQWWVYRRAFPRFFGLVLLSAALAICSIEGARYIDKDRAAYGYVLDRANSSQLVASGRDLNAAILSKLPSNGSIRILRDSFGYFLYIPAIDKYDVRAFSGLAIRRNREDESSAHYLAQIQYRFLFEYNVSSSLFRIPRGRSDPLLRESVRTRQPPILSRCQRE
jgi:hypothetical protein